MIRFLLLATLSVALINCTRDNVFDNDSLDNIDKTKRSLSIQLATNNTTNENSIETTMASNEVLEVNLTLITDNVEEDSSEEPDVEEGDMEEDDVEEDDTEEDKVEKVKFERLYITQKTAQGVTERFENTRLNLQGVFPDNSIVLDQALSKIDLTFDLNVPELTDGRITYKIWATDSLGDFRNSSLNRITSIAEIVVNQGNSINPDKPIREFKDVTLVPHTIGGTTNTIFSLFTATTFQLSGGLEFNKLWDFAYTDDLGAVNFYSADNYIENFNFNIEEINDAKSKDVIFNQMFFAKSTTFVEDYLAINLSEELNTITKPTATRVLDVKINDVIEFQDNYGNKGLIWVKQIDAVNASQPSNAVVFDIKMQSN